MDNWTVRRRIQVSFAIVIAIMMLMTATSFYWLTHIKNTSHHMQSDALPGQFHLVAMRGAWDELFLHILGQSRLGDATGLLAEQEQLAQRLEQSIGDYQATVSDAGDQTILDRFKGLVTQARRDNTTALEQLRHSNGGDHAPTIGALKQRWSEGNALLVELTTLNRQLATRDASAIVEAAADAEIVLVVASVLAIVVALLCGLSLMRAITEPVHKVAEALRVLATGNLSQRLKLMRNDEFGAIETDFNHMANELKTLVEQAQRSAVQVTTSVTEIAATSRQQQATATETAATTTEIGATSREIAATSRDLVMTMTEVSDTAEQTSVLAGAGQNELLRMEETMHQVMGAAELVNTKLAVINEKAGNINQVVTTIVKVADQTNLLSLNAAIEAEKAGEYGRGFAVVATEVRRLADQTAVATYDIEQMVREMQSAVSAGVMGMDKFSEEVRRGIAEVGQVGGQLGQIIQQVQALAPRVQMVSEGMQAQATGAEQINQALAQLGETTTQTVESLRQASAAIDEMNQVANALRTSVTRFTV